MKGWSIRVVRGTRRYRTDLHAYEAQYAVRTPQGSDHLVWATARSEVPERVAQQQWWEAESAEQTRAMLTSPHLYSQHNYATHCRGGRLYAEAAHAHRAYVEAALAQGLEVPAQVLEGYPDLAHAGRSNPPACLKVS